MTTLTGTSRLTVHRDHTPHGPVITLVGEIDLDSAPQLRQALAQALREEITTLDIDVTAVNFCDCSGLNAFLSAAQQATAAGGSLRLLHPGPVLHRLVDLTDCDFLLQPLPGEPPPRRADKVLWTLPAPNSSAVYAAMDRLSPRSSAPAGVAL